MKNYPMIALSDANRIAEVASTAKVTEVRDRYLSEWNTETSIFYRPVGTRATTLEMFMLRDKIVAEASSRGFPVGFTSEAAPEEFDEAVALILRSDLKISLSHASEERFWAYMTCLLLPDVVRWRWGKGGQANADRFLTSRRNQRNAFGRLWWRAEFFPTQANNFHRVRLLEDEMVAILERPSLTTSRRVCVAIASALLDAVTDGSNETRRSIVRSGMRRIRRLSSFVVFEALSDHELGCTFKAAFLGRSTPDYSSCKEPHADSVSGDGSTQTSFRSIRVPSGEAGSHSDSAISDVCLSLLDGGAGVPERSGLNWGMAGGRPRNTDECYIAIPSSKCRELKQVLGTCRPGHEFIAICHDGTRLNLRLQGKRLSTEGFVAKQISTAGRTSDLGAWLLRKCLQITPGFAVTLADLQRYGRTDVVIRKRRDSGGLDLVEVDFAPPQGVVRTEPEILREVDQSLTEDEPPEVKVLNLPNILDVKSEAASQIPCPSKYVEWSIQEVPPLAGVAAGDTLTPAQERIAVALRDIVRVEGPVTWRRVTDLYRRGLGLGRLRGPTRLALVSVAETMVRRGLVIETEKDEADWYSNVVHVPGAPCILVRERGPRELDDIPICEIAKLMEFKGLFSGNEPEFRTVLSFYGFSRLTQGALARLESASILVEKIDGRTSTD